jgi:starch synthase
MLDRHASALKAGIIAADALSTVSPRYAREIQTAEQGHGLDWLLRARRDRLAGITNGVDYDIWNPETDPHIAANFSATICQANVSARSICCDALDYLRIRIDRSSRSSRDSSVRKATISFADCSPILGTDRFSSRSAQGAREYEDFLQRWHDTRAASGRHLQRLRRRAARAPDRSRAPTCFSCRRYTSLAV